jgi:hypothetical protein
MSSSTHTGIRRPLRLHVTTWTLRPHNDQNHPLPSGYRPIPLERSPWWPRPSPAPSHISHHLVNPLTWWGLHHRPSMHLRTDRRHWQEASPSSHQLWALETERATQAVIRWRHAGMERLAHTDTHPTPFRRPVSSFRTSPLSALMGHVVRGRSLGEIL